MCALGARMVPFAGYDMPVQYPDRHHRPSTTGPASTPGLFDVSHMGQASSCRARATRPSARALEALVPGRHLSLKPGQQRYTQLLNDDGGILDDLMVTRSADPAEDGVLMLVVNAAMQGRRLRPYRSASADGRQADRAPRTAR